MFVSAADNAPAIRYFTNPPKCDDSGGANESKAVRQCINAERAFQWYGAGKVLGIKVHHTTQIVLFKERVSGLYVRVQVLNS